MEKTSERFRLGGMKISRHLPLSLLEITSSISSPPLELSTQKSNGDSGAVAATQVDNGADPHQGFGGFFCRDRYLFLAPQRRFLLQQRALQFPSHLQVSPFSILSSGFKNRILLSTSVHLLVTLLASIPNISITQFVKFPFGP